MKYKKLLKEFGEIQAEGHSCKMVYCSTCGGLAFAVKQNMTTKLINDINEALSEMSISDFKDLGDWGYFFQEIDSDGVVSVFEREEKRIEVSDIRQLDRYLFEARKVMLNKSSYKKLLKLGIDVAVKTSDDSLIETVSIILGEDILNHEELLSLALKKSKSNEDIHRVLYNSVREQVPEVRGFVGDGTTSWGW